MKKNGKNEELQSRREFFKRAAKGALPILAGAALLSSPILSETANAMSCAGCNNRCMNSCFNTLKSYIYNSVAELRVNYLQITFNYTFSFLSAVIGCCRYNLSNTCTCLAIIFQQCSTKSTLTDIINSMSYQFSNMIIMAEFTCSISNTSVERHV